MTCYKQVPSSLSSEKCIEEEQEEKWKHFTCPLDLSFAQHSTFGFAVFPSNTQLYETTRPPNISHELNVAKSLLQSASSNTGDNLFDHLADMIKRALKDPCENIVDYFEEYSHNLRAQKFRIKEPFKWTYYEPPDVQRAKQVLSMIKFTTNTASGYDVCKDYNSEGGEADNIVDFCVEHRKLTRSENVLRLHLYWSLCGFNISMDEAVHLSLAIQKIQYLPIIKHARFWGKIYGLKKFYYIVEASLTPEEIKVRLAAMKFEMIEKIHLYSDIHADTDQKNERDPELIPGYNWRDRTDEALKTMMPEAAMIPKPKLDLKFNVPPEPIGAGANKLTYFVVNSLLDDWIELPIVTPNQVQISRKIRHLLTGDLEAEVLSFPQFPGNEKHFLRAIIARITAGTYIAPKNYYRKMTKIERAEAMGEECFEDELEEGEFDEEEVGEDNDAPIIEDASYEPDAHTLSTVTGWVHVRPNILEQGRVRWFNVEKVRRQLEKESKVGQKCFDEEDEEEIGEIDEGSEYDEDAPEVGPALFSNCYADQNSDNVPSWSARHSSVHNDTCQLVLMRSNIWPGAFAFSTEKYSDCIYLGLGCKYTARNHQAPHLPPVLDEHYPDKFIEITDPNREVERAYKMWLRRRDELMKLMKRHPEEEGEEDDETDSCRGVV